MCNQPRMLKELLADEESYACSVNSNKKLSPKLLRSRSKAALTTIFAIKKALNVVKYLKFSTVKSPLAISPKNCRNADVADEISTTVQVKDILRWRSFRDLVDDKPRSLDFSSSPHRCTTATTTTGTTSTGSNSSRTSWCDSDFTADDSELFPGDDCKDEKSSQFEENVALVNAVQAITSEFETNSGVEQLLLDFFRDESNTNEYREGNYEIDCELLRLAKNWMSRETEGCSEWRFGGSKELCMREMEWSDFEEERENLAMETENEVLRSLMDEVLVDLFRFVNSD